MGSIVDRAHDLAVVRFLQKQQVDAGVATPQHKALNM